MTDKADSVTKALHEESLAFFGAVTASISHELNNVISILDQSAGLVGDLVAGSRAGRPLSPEKLQQIAESMQRQTQRGLEIMRRMNKFAHSSDRGPGGCDVNETVANFGSLCQRWADMKRVSLTVTQSPRQRAATIDPFLLQCWLYVMVRHFLVTAKPGEALSITVADEDTQSIVTIAGPGGVAFEESGGPDPELMVRSALGATVHCVRTENSTRVSLHLGGIKETMTGG
jgi:C4-dicarboxylate-specific signal transduction histidine kinase